MHCTLPSCLFCWELQNLVFSRQLARYQGTAVTGKPYLVLPDEKAVHQWPRSSSTDCNLAGRPAWWTGYVLKTTCQQTSYVLLQSCSASHNLCERLVQTSKPLWVNLQCCEKPVWSVTSRVSHVADAWCVHCVAMASCVTLQPGCQYCHTKKCFLHAYWLFMTVRTTPTTLAYPNSLVAYIWHDTQTCKNALDGHWLGCHKQFSQHDIFHLYCCTSISCWQLQFREFVIGFVPLREMSCPALSLTKYPVSKETKQTQKQNIQ